MSPSTLRSELACIKFEERAIQKGGIVSRPALECAYDRILDLDGVLSRVQIKHANGTPTEGAITCKLARFGHGGRKLYQLHEIDAFAIYIPKIEAICWFPVAELLGKGAVVLRFAPPKTQNGMSARLVDNYRW